MAIRLAALALLIAASAQLTSLWPPPGEAASRKMAYWRDLRAKAEAVDVAKSERPAYDARAKVELLKSIDEILSDPSEIRREAQLHWALWLVSAAIAAFAAVATFQGLRHWRWLALASAALFFWLHRPLALLDLFFVNGTFSFQHGTAQVAFISQHPVELWTMVLFSIAVPMLLAAAVAYGFYSAHKTTGRAADAP